VENACWFLELVLKVLLVVEGVEVNPGPPVEECQINEILKKVKSQERESKVTQNLSETHT
jgi:hypothetical protein